MMKQKKLYTAVALALGLTACSNSSDKNDTPDHERTISGMTFQSLPLANTDEQKKQMRISDKMTVNYSDGSHQDYALSYKILAKMGDPIGSSFSPF